MGFTCDALRPFKAVPRATAAKRKKTRAFVFEGHG
jgi:hypothetical protein